MTPQADVFFVPFDEASTVECMVLAKAIRALGISAIVDTRSVRLRRKLQWATEMASYFAVIVGADEIASSTAQVKDLDERQQIAVPFSDLPDYLARQLLSAAAYAAILRAREFGLV